MEHRVPGALTNKDAAVGGKVLQQIPPFHLRLQFDGNYFAARGCGSLREKPIFFQNEVEGFFQIPARFRQRLTLGVDPWNLFHPGNIPWAFLLNYGGEFSGH